mgnify:FL=1
MRVVINQRHLSLNRRLARESNKLVKRFNNKSYSKIGDIESILLKRDISVEKKKSMLVKKLHEAVTTAFSIDKKNFNKNTFESLKKRLDIIRRTVIRLRSINYYLETMFLEDLRLSKTKAKGKGSRLKLQNGLVRNELEALEYIAYRLIEEAVVLDKRLLKEYKHKEKDVIKREKIEIKDIGLILRKESAALEHLEAKLPPPKAASVSLMKEPTFTHWVARVFALLSYLEHMYGKESVIFSKLKKNKATRTKINRKIIHIMKERARLLKVMQEKAVSMKKFRMDSKLRKELHNLTTTIAL